MAGTLSHLMICEEFLKKQQNISVENWGHFMLGNCFPDAAYWPGEDQIVSDLAHYLMAARIPEILYKLHEKEDWKAFALGWLFHLQTDVVLHPFINKLAAKYYYKNDYRDQIYTYEDSKSTHVLIENSLDKQLLHSNNLGNVKAILPANIKYNKIADAIIRLYPINPNKNKIENLLKKIPGRIDKYLNFLRNYEKHKWYQTIVNIVIKVVKPFIGLEQRKIIENFLSALDFDKEDLQIYQATIDKLIIDFSTKQKPDWFVEDINFDTGNISKLGEYGIADELYAKLNDSELIKPKLWMEFCKIFERGN